QETKRRTEPPRPRASSSTSPHARSRSAASVPWQAHPFDRPCRLVPLAVCRMRRISNVRRGQGGRNGSDLLSTIRSPDPPTAAARALLVGSLEPRLDACAFAFRTSTVATLGANGPDFASEQLARFN